MIEPRNKVRYRITLEGERRGDTAHAHTLRYLLKHLLRSRSLKCIDAREVGARAVEEQEPRE
jgi:hypothetical protein